MNYIINMATTKKPTINTTTGGNVVGTIQPTHEGATSVNYSQLSTPPTPTPTQKQPITQTPVVKQTPAVTQTPSSTVKPTTITTSANNVNIKTPTETLSTFDLQNAQNAAQNLNK